MGANGISVDSDSDDEYAGPHILLNDILNVALINWVTTIILIIFLSIIGRDGGERQLKQLGR